jgi:hypothetical protein
MAGIQKILTQFDSYARPNRFEIEIFPPKGVSLVGSGVAEYSQLVLPESVQGQFNTINKFQWTADKVSVAAHTVIMPGRDVSTLYDHKTNTSYAAGVYKSGNVPASFYENPTMNVRRFLDQWHQMVINVKNQTANFYSEYVGTVVIYQLNRKNERTYGVMLKEAYPSDISSMELSFNTENNVSSTTTTFIYKSWFGDVSPFTFSRAK